jgi:hypothetical protein
VPVVALEQLNVQERCGQGNWVEKINNTHDPAEIFTRCVSSKICKKKKIKTITDAAGKLYLRCGCGGRGRVRRNNCCADEVVVMVVVVVVVVFSCAADASSSAWCWLLPPSQWPSVSGNAVDCCERCAAAIQCRRSRP